MDKNSLKVGVVGCGEIAKNVHIPVFKSLKDVEVVAVCDKNKSLVFETSKIFNIPKAYTDIDKMLQVESLDLLSICTPPQTHFNLSIRAMSFGVHVLVEKPMALTLKEAEKMVTVSRKNKVKLCIAHNFLFNPVIQKSKKIVEKGIIGKIINVEVNIFSKISGKLANPNHWCHHLPGGIIGEYGPHAVYVAQTFLGKIHEIHAVKLKSTVFPFVLADGIKVLLKGDKSIGSFSVLCNSSKYSFEVDIFGEKGTLHLDIYPFPRIFKVGKENLHPLLTIKEDLFKIIQTITSFPKVLLTKPISQIYKTHKILIRMFVESIRKNGNPPITGEEGKETVRILGEALKRVGLLNFSGK